MKKETKGVEINIFQIFRNFHLQIYSGDDIEI